MNAANHTGPADYVLSSGPGVCPTVDALNFVLARRHDDTDMIEGLTDIPIEQLYMLLCCVSDMTEAVLDFMPDGEAEHFLRHYTEAVEAHVCE